MLKEIVVLLLAISASSVTSFAQIRKVPAEVTAAFSKQYVTAENISYKDNLKSFHVHFTFNGAQMIAKYNAVGGWIETDKIVAFTLVPPAVKEGWEKSKYWNWEVTEAVIIQHPSGTEQYRLKVEKNDIQKKFLFYTKSGRLIRDAITL